MNNTGSQDQAGIIYRRKDKCRWPQKIEARDSEMSREIIQVDAFRTKKNMIRESYLLE
jgi:hypothetical protein